MYEEKNVAGTPLTFRRVFESLNRLGNHSLFGFDGERIIPLESRTRLVFIDVGFGFSDKLSSSKLLQVPLKELADAIGDNFRQHLSEAFLFTYYDPSITSKKAVIDFTSQFENTAVCIQQKTREELRRKYWVSTEELGELICMLYFREKGYIVQRPLHTYGREGDGQPGVDDVIAWKSPVLRELKEFGFVNTGCHISELACLRWLGKISSSSVDFDVADTAEALLIEVEPSLERAISTSASTGISQLLRASKAHIAKNLFISFPCVGENLDEVLTQIRSIATDEAGVGKVLLHDSGIYFEHSNAFPDDNVSLLIQEYENNLKRMLLKNFYFDEIVRMIEELNLDTKSKGFDEVWIDFCGNVAEIPINYLLQRISRLIE